MHQTYVIPANSLCFISTHKPPIWALVEPNMGATGLCKALLTVYSAQSKIAMLNLGPQHTLAKGTQVAEAIPL